MTVTLVAGPAKGNCSRAGKVRPGNRYIGDAESRPGDRCNAGDRRGRPIGKGTGPFG